MKSCVVRLSTAILFCFVSHAALAATTNLVTIGDFLFSPKNLTITNGDTVQWRNVAAVNSHDSTSSNSPPVWASGLRSPGQTFEFKFSSAGFYPYHCQFHQTFHPEQNGTINVLSGNLNFLPSVSITNPVNNATFTDPATFPIQASASDFDGTVAQVEFFQNTTSLGVDTASPYSVTASNLAAGAYTLSAVATDNSGGKATNSISITVKAPPNAVTLNPALSGNSFNLSFLSQSGYTYSVTFKVNIDDAAWQLLKKTNGTGSTIVITDPTTSNQRFYEVTAQ